MGVLADMLGPTALLGQHAAGLEFVESILHEDPALLVTRRSANMDLALCRRAVRDVMDSIGQDEEQDSRFHALVMLVGTGEQGLDRIEIRQLEKAFGRSRAEREGLMASVWLDVAAPFCAAVKYGHPVEYIRVDDLAISRESIVSSVFPVLLEAVQAAPDPGSAFRLLGVFRDAS